MLAGLKKFWRDIMTEDNGGTTYCPVRIFAASFVTLFHTAVIYQFVKHGIFDPLGYAGGASALIGSTGAAIGVKSKLGADAETPNHG